MMYTGIITACSSALIGVIWALINMRYTNKSILENEKRRAESYLGYIEKQRNRIYALKEELRQSMIQMYPDTKQCLQYSVQAKELWTRNREHKDFLTERIGLGAGDISTVVQKGDKVAIIISDVTRKWQAIPTYLPILVDRLNKCGIADEDIIVISACGTHRRQTDEEHKELLGEDLFKRLKIVDHQCEDKENLVYMGETSRKTPVWLNRYAIEADKIILTGGVVYHFLACSGEF